MNKFKFGDRVWHEKYGLCLITRSEPLGLYGIAHNHPAMAQIPWLISESELTLDANWIGCCERLPESGVAVLTYNSWSKKMECEFLRYSDDKRIAWWSTTQESGDVTHWMPLPAPPVEVE